MKEVIADCAVLLVVSFIVEFVGVKAIHLVEEAGSSEGQFVFY